jgi:hypothetical protein
VNLRPSLTAVPQRRVLHSWKEIADYLQVTPRTAQRWEQQDNLPVHHLGAGPKARVEAYSDELDAWASVGTQRRGGIRPQSAEALRSRMFAWQVTTVALCVLVLLVGGFVIYRTYFFAAAPVRAAVEGAALAVYDSRGRLCWRRELPGVNPDAYVPMSNAAFRTAVPARFDTVVVEDIDQDGRTEVLFNYFPKPLPESQGRLICYEENGRVRWEFPFGRERRAGDYQLGLNYRGTLIHTVYAHGRPWVLAVSHHDPGFPAQAAVLDIRTGRVHQEYWHPGWIVVGRVCDLDGDGSQEILLAGYNNPGAGVGHAGMAVLKVAAVPQPPAPDRVEPGLEGFSGGGEIAYFLFPRSDLLAAMGTPPYVDMLEVYDGNRILVRTLGAQYANLLYYFDFNLRLVKAGMDDGYASVHDQWRRRGLVDHELTQAEGAELGKVQRFRHTPNGNSAEIHRFWNLP